MEWDLGRKLLAPADGADDDGDNSSSWISSCGVGKGWRWSSNGVMPDAMDR